MFADAMRSKGGIENRAAVLEGQRFELFRGKDLVRWVKAHPERGAAAAAGAGRRAQLSVGGGRRDLLGCSLIVEIMLVLGGMRTACSVCHRQHFAAP